MNGVTIGEKHSYNDFGLILSSVVISPPKPQTKSVAVPMRDGSIDLTEAVTGEVKFNDRSIKMTFTVIDPINTWSAKVSEIQNYIHGKRLKIILDKDCAFYYIGRISVNEWTSERSIGTLVVEGTVEPFKYDILSSAVDWEWDVFDFEEGIINETGQLIVNGERTITLICRRKRMFPTFTASAEMEVWFEGEPYRLKKGSQKIYDIFFSEGENTLKFTGNGTISIDYIGGSL